jgi:hypothetical protein
LLQVEADITTLHGYSEPEPTSLFQSDSSSTIPATPQFLEEKQSRRSKSLPGRIDTERQISSTLQTGLLSTLIWFATAPFRRSGNY